jgi:hypothetical protein
LGLVQVVEANSFAGCFEQLKADLQTIKFPKEECKISS